MKNILKMLLSTLFYNKHFTEQLYFVCLYFTVCYSYVKVIRNADKLLVNKDLYYIQFPLIN